MRTRPGAAAGVRGRRPPAVWPAVAVVAAVVAHPFAAAARGEEPEAPVGRGPEGRLETPVGQVVAPVGRQVELPGMRPQSLAISPDGRLLVTSGKTNEVVVIDPATGEILARVQPPAEETTTPTAASDGTQKPDTQAIESYAGLIFAPDGKRLFMSNVHGSIKVFAVADGGVTASHTIPLPPANAPQRAAEIPAGLAVSADGLRLYACGNLSNRLHEIDVSAGTVSRSFDVGVAPQEVVLVGGLAFVSNRGGRRPTADDLTGPAGRGTRVRVDPARHVAAEGSVSIVDLPSGEVREVVTGRHAAALAVSPDGGHVVCANAGDDTLSIISVAGGKVAGTVTTKRTPAELHGAAPAALAFSPDGRTLYACNAAQNALALLAWNPDAPRDTRLVGLLPVGWYPGAVVCDPFWGQLAVANIKGLPPTPRKHAATEGFNSHQYHGSVSLVPLPTMADLPALSEIVARNLRSENIAAARLPARPAREPRAIPERIGEPSLIEHVVYVIKENRTYDQVLGDLPQGRGRKELCVFGEEFTPNQHALARRFVLLDNTYCCGILSADGHNWSTAALANEYLERSFAGFPRSYPDGGGNDASADALAWSPAGFLWDRAVERGKTIRNYGEFMIPRVRWKDPRRRDGPDFADCFAAWKAAAADVVFESEPAIESIRPFSPTGTVGWDMRVCDQFRADFVLAELAEHERRGSYPELVIICLPNDHTNGTAHGSPTPAACVADNDLAFGRIVEGLSGSRFWPKMAIFAIEDDPQAGWDHVSGYRTTCYVASPYARRGVTVGTRYNTTSILRTIGQILGLPPLNQFDAAAVPMFDCFTDVPDLTPFTSLPTNVPLDQMNPDPKAILDPVLRAGALASAAMNFLEIDKAPEDALNRTLWHAMKGSAAPFPEWATSPPVDDDDEEEEQEQFREAEAG